MLEMAGKALVAQRACDMGSGALSSEEAPLLGGRGLSISPCAML